jgi:hypothetical protein
MGFFIKADGSRDGIDTNEFSRKSTGAGFGCPSKDGVASIVVWPTADCSMTGGFVD